MVSQVILSCCLLAGVTLAYVIPEPPAPDVDQQLAVLNAAPKCMDDLGCFPIGPEFFHTLYRPINFNPSDKEKIRTRFLLYTKSSPKKEQFLVAKDTKSFTASGFKSSRKTKVIIHGYLDNQWFGDWMRNMKDEFLLNGDHNVVIVDWSGGNGLPYTQATANTRVVGAEIALLLQWLKDTQGLKLEDVHILGHSLGAHAAGYAGERLKSLGRITGMDPAEPFFQNLPPSVRLDPTDAQFVDIIHTDSKSILRGGLGMSQLIGHVDIFPNDGQSQPGCDITRIKDFITEGIVGGVRTFVACNHHRAMDFALDSINHNKCLPVAYACTDWATFLQGKCADCGSSGDRCALMGEKAKDHYFSMKDDNKQQKFFIKTNNKEPFCLHHYKVTLVLKKDGGKDQKGDVKLTLKGKNGQADFALSDGKINLYHGSTYTFLATTPTDIGDISSATFRWDQNIIGSVIWKGSIMVDTLEVVPMSTLDKSVRTKQTRNYCVAKKGLLKTRTDFTFYSSDLC